MHKIWRLNNKVQVIICDSPLPNSIVYDKEDSEPFHALVLEQFDKFNNRNFFIKRGTDYVENGRLQTLEEARKIDEKVLSILTENHIPYTTLPIDKASDTIVETILNELKES